MIAVYGTAPDLRSSATSCPFTSLRRKATAANPLSPSIRASSPTSIPSTRQAGGEMTAVPSNPVVRVLGPTTTSPTVLADRFKLGVSSVGESRCNRPCTEMTPRTWSSGTEWRGSRAASFARSSFPSNFDLPRTPASTTP